jgi:lipid A 4'-phosphatase
MKIAKNSIKNYLIFLTGVVGLLLIIYPNIDLTISSLFYSEEEGFYLKHNYFVKFIHKFVPYIAMVISLWIVTGIIINHLNTPYVKTIHLIYLLACLMIGPGLFVNYIFKDNFNRARPSQIVEFGGEKSFTPASIISNQCTKNCSFVSGHAAIGFYFSAFAFLIKRYRLAILFLSIFFGAGIGFVRILQGGHFISDIFFAGIVVNLVNYILYLVFKKKL